MANVKQYIIIYFTMMVHGSMSISFDKNLCLETVARFLYDGGMCGFNKSTALSFLKYVTTCPNTCNVRISDLDSYKRYSVKSIALMTGSERTHFNTCSYSFGYEQNLYINCSSWNTKEYMTWKSAYACSMNDAQCIHIFNYCVCHCMPGYILKDEKCLKKKVTIGGICELNWQCQGTAFAVCDHDVCSCSPGYMQIGRMCYPGNLGINDFCEQQEQCIQPFSGCFNGSCKCKNGYSAFNTNRCLKDTVPVGGFCDLDKQCTGSNNSGTCEHERCTCAKEFTLIDSACEKNQPNSLGSSNSQQYGTNIGVTVGSLFGGFILGVIVTAVVTTLMYRRLNFRTPNRKEPDVMFAANREYGTAGGAQISFTNNKKQNVATLSPYSFAKETQGFNLSSKQDDKRTEDVYNHLREQTEQDDDTYDHACAVPNHSSDLSDYSNIHDATNFQTSPSKDGDDYSTLRN